MSNPEGFDVDLLVAQFQLLTLEAPQKKPKPSPRLPAEILLMIVHESLCSSAEQLSAFTTVPDNGPIETGSWPRVATEFESIGKTLARVCKLFTNKVGRFFQEQERTLTSQLNHRRERFITYKRERPLPRDSILRTLIELLRIINMRCWTKRVIYDINSEIFEEKGRALRNSVQAWQKYGQLLQKKNEELKKNNQELVHRERILQNENHALKAEIAGLRSEGEAEKEVRASKRRRLVHDQ